MSPTREEALFALALTKPVAERATWLDNECAGDPALRKRLEALLAAHERPNELLATEAHQTRPTMKIVFDADPGDDAGGSTIGRYKLLERVGEGGCGVVYVAEQTELVRRRVALKVIKLGMDTRQVVARFEAERQALAMMDHPNIAKVLDAGTTDTGRPYFVMELVRGIKITDYCDQANLSTKERLDLFIKVCQAIQHAHQKGIIHRDIKPSNILVTLHDGVPVPKVIDFGIAKATEGRLTDNTVYTQLHQFIGTPAYMSPEQAEMSGLDIDTRSDIYSLGVLLYELLTGSTPFDAKELMASGIDGMRKTIREKEPPRPSTKLTEALVAAEVTRRTPGEDEPSADSRRRLRVKETIHQLQGDLDWIVMKCLEKDRSRRYETANGLAAELKRYLNNEPVVARPPSAAYRLGKLLARNKAASLAVAAVVFGLVFGIGFSTYAFLRERKAFRALVETERQAAIERARFAVVSGDEQRVEQTLKEAARVGVPPDLILVLRAYHLFVAGTPREVIELLRPLVDPPSQNVAALSLYALAHGRWHEYQRLLPRLHAARPVTHEDHLFLGQALALQDTRAGLALLEQAVQLQDSPAARAALAQERMGWALLHQDASGVERALEDVRAAEAWARHSLTMIVTSSGLHTQAGLFYRRTGEDARAKAAFQTAEATGRRLESFYPNEHALGARAWLLSVSGRETEALDRLQQWAGDLPELRPACVVLHWELGRSREAYDRLRQWSDAVWHDTDPWVQNLSAYFITMDLPKLREEHLQWLAKILSEPSSGTGDLYAAYLALTARGELERARDYARAWRVRNPALAPALGPHFSRLLRYKCGELGDATFLAESRDSAFNNMEAHTFIGLAALARGDRVLAIEHLSAGEATGGSGNFLRGILRRLRADPNWPPAIASAP